MTTIRERVTAACAFDGELRNYIECRAFDFQERRWSHGSFSDQVEPFMQGAIETNARLTPLITALIDVCEAAERALDRIDYEYPEVSSSLDDALAALREVCDE